ncbi:hypothetical protein [Aneurinibacillus terranovensis]|uniref:hypothetical protein n=1 Tax=Aneurinibacillus terranovensis TaxID=278991 RepID=UPI000480CE7E|nr:hypothetical protein [Aneurinibacillus terranovensis]
MKTNGLKINLQFFAGIGFTPNNGNKTVNDELSDDPTMKEIIQAGSAIELLAIKKRLANEPLTEMDRRIYYEAIDVRASKDFGSWSIESAAREEEEEAEEKTGEIGFKVQVTTDSIEPRFAVITDGVGEMKDICLSKAVVITDGANKPSGWYKQPVSRVDAINDNSRLYPRAVYQPALDAIKQAGFPYAGEHPHPRSYRAANGQIRFESAVPNQAVKFRDAYIDATGVVWAEYRPLDTEMGRQVKAMLDAGLPIGFSNRMTGDIVGTTVNGKTVGVAKQLNLFTWDVVLNPAEPEAFTNPEELTDSVVSEILDSINKGDDSVNFLTMSVQQLREWKAANVGHKDMALCDQAIVLKEKADQVTAITDELEQLRNEKKQREEQEAVAKKKAEAQKALTDAVNALPYDGKVKEALIAKGAEITDAAEVESFVEKEKAFIDSVAVTEKLKGLGIKPAGGKAAILDTSIQVVGEVQPWEPIVDKLQDAFDDRFRAIDKNFRVDKKLREGNNEIVDRIMKKMDRENHEEYRKMMQTLNDSAVAIQDGVITDSAATSTGDLAQVPIVSLAFMRQVFQDLKFLQLVMAEPFSGTTYRIPVEFQSEDLYTQDDFVVGEYDGIPSEGVETFLLEFGAEWLKRATIISKEAQVELMNGPFNYDIVARNLANVNMRFQRVIDQKLSLEMLCVSDEYGAVEVDNEAVAAAEIKTVTPGQNGIPSTSNAAWVVDLLCGQTSGALQAQRPPIVRPRTKQWLDEHGRKQTAQVNQITAVVGTTTLKRGTWDFVKGVINNGDYAVDFESGKVYFTTASGVNNTDKLPKMSYSYATNVSYFNLTVPNGVDASKYYNLLLEQLDTEKAYMGSAPRYVTPDFAIGSLNAMVAIKKAELFYKYASPDGTNLLKGDMYFATRNGLQLGEINAPWAAGDRRMLLGKMNATRFGIGSPMQMEGPFPYIDPATSQITSAKQYFATEQVAISTPQVIDKYGNTYNPPYRTIKFYNS